MVSVGEVKRWNPGALQEIATTIRSRLETLVHAGDDFGQVLPADGWTGAAADAASAAHARQMERIEKLAASAGFVIKGVSQAADAIPAVQREIANMESLAQKYSFRVEDSGAVTDLFAGQKPPSDLHPEDRAQAKQQISDGITQALRVAEDIGYDLTNVFDRARGGEVPTGNGTTVASAAEAGSAAMALTTPLPPEHATPQQNAAWWAALSPAERRATINDPVNRVGNLDGIPAEVRSQANMRALPRIENDLQRRIAELRNELDGLGRPGFQGKEMTFDELKRQHEINQELNGLHDKVSALNSLGNTVAQSAGLPPDQRYYLLGVNGDGSGRAILAKGNPDTASNVATYVPGTSSNLSNVTGDTRTRTDAMWRAAGGEKTGTSVIAWQGYDAPPSFTDAASESYAEDGKNALNGFQQGLRETHQGSPSHNTIVGHSYGTTLMGHAAHNGNISADALVFAGSPGVGVDHASQLNIPPQNVYSTVARNDVINLANTEISVEPGNPGRDFIHGPDPTDPDFGGRTFTSNPGTPGALGGVSTDAHSEYWEPGNPSLVNMGLIIDGRQPNAR